VLLRALDDVSTTVLAEGGELEGNIETPAHASIAGRLHGDIVARGLVRVEVTAHLVGALQAVDAIIEGAVEGPITLAGRLEVGPRARLAGPIRAARMDVAEGAVLQGPLDVREGPHSFSEKRSTT
jgi:cytoskeletal protein CcmA (bactofilin family)